LKGSGISSGKIRLYTATKHMGRTGTESNNRHDTLRIGIVGAGGISANLHIPTLQAIEDVEIAWITDVDTKKAEALASACRVPCARLPATPEGLPPADVILLGIPYGARPGYYEAFRGRNTALYVEKPFERTPEAHTALCSLFPAFMLACGFQRRASGAAKTTAEILEDRLFGELHAIRLGYGSRGRLSSGGFLSDFGLAAGGPLMELAIHGIDLALVISRADGFDRVRGQMLTDGPFDMHTTAVVDLKLPGNRRIPFELEVSSLIDTRNCLEFVCERATVSFALSSNVVRVTPANGTSQYTIDGASGGNCLTSYQQSYETWNSFLSGVRTRTPNWTSASTSVLTTSVVAGVYKLGYPMWPETAPGQRDRSRVNGQAR
jgi:predicted dehydrogenase